jgi:hypothetical protein
VGVHEVRHELYLKIKNGKRKRKQNNNNILKIRRNSKNMGIHDKKKRGEGGKLCRQ